MKKLTVTLTVFVDDQVEYEGAVLTTDEVLKDLYDHTCAWELNQHGTVEFIDEQVISAEIGE